MGRHIPHFTQLGAKYLKLLGTTTWTTPKYLVQLFQLLTWEWSNFYVLGMVYWCRGTLHMVLATS